MEELQLELADALAESHRNFGIEQARQALKEQVDPNFDGANCLDCADPIPPERLALRRMRCTPCQTLIETRKKLQGR